MGLEAAYVPYIVAAVGAGASAANQEHTRRKQDRQLAAGIKLQGDKQQQAAQEVNALVNRRAKSNPNAARTNAEAQLIDTLRRNSAGKGAVENVLGASERYRSQVEQGNESVGDFGSQLGGDIAAVDSFARQRQEEGEDAMRTSTAIGQIQRAAAGDDAVNQLRVRSITPNPWVELAANMAKNYGSAAAMKGAGGSFLKQPYSSNPATGLTPMYDADPLRAYA